MLGPLPAMPRLGRLMQHMWMGEKR